MKIGLVGLPAVGKTTLFNLLTGAEPDTTDYSKIKVEGTLGIAKVPDERVDFLAKLYNPRKITYATIEVIDLPGLVKGSSMGEGVGNKFLENVRKTDALIHIVRAFENDNVPHVDGNIDPMRDIETINLELLFSDLGVIENRIHRIETGKKITKENLAELEVLKKCREGLENGVLLHNIELSEEERNLLKTFSFLSEKPIIFVINLDEKQFTSKDYPGKEELASYTKQFNIPMIELCIKSELEISQLDPEDRKLFMEDLGITETGIDKLARTTYDYLGLISFLTTGEDEVKAWTIKRGTTAKKAAGKIHSDIEKGFIRAEVCKFEHLKELGSMQKVKEKGLLTLEGKDYIVQDGDIINFRFNV
ncbi:MAG TPA: redox-regulated ATPase YchF [Clostridiaceae bacterium]|nr:redox-regulated ATPase YchF [Clostridiaceae bacterium]